MFLVQGLPQLKIGSLRLKLQAGTLAYGVHDEHTLARGVQVRANAQDCSRSHRVMQNCLFGARDVLGFCRLNGKCQCIFIVELNIVNSYHRLVFVSMN